MYFLGSEMSVNFLVSWILIWGLVGSVVNWFFGPTKKRLLPSVIEGYQRAFVFAGIFFVVGAVFQWLDFRNPKEKMLAESMPSQRVTRQPEADQDMLFDINFAEKKQLPDQIVTSVQTREGEFGFSTHGATLVDASFFRTLPGERKQEFAVWKRDYFIENDQLPFMVGLDQDTPYVYELVDHQDNEKSAVLTYKAHSDQGTIVKTFVINKEQSLIDLELTVQPKKAMRPRIVWSSPMLKDLGEYDASSSFVIMKNDKFKLISSGKIDVQQAYMQPQVFGSANKYFVCAAVKDEDNFIGRAYSKVVNGDVISYLQAPEVTEKTSWKISFYFGPKELQPLGAVDTRLEKVLDYGMFSFITKPMIRVLKYIDSYTHNYGYAILLVTLLLKLLLLPFTFRGEKKMREIQENQRKMDYLAKKYKDNQEALKQAQAENAMQNLPIMLGGCLPMLAQMPFFVGLNGALNNSLELYKQPFIWWMKDLSLPDPFYILPFLLFLTMFITMSSTSSKKGIRGLMGPLAMSMLMGAFFSSMASGLALYIVANSLLHVIQTRAQKALKL